MFVLNVDDEKCTETQLEILFKINTGEYRLVKKNKRSSVWNVYREIARPDGSKLKWRFYCLGCKRVMQSTGGTTSNLRIHKCHVRYLKQCGDGDARQSSPSPTPPPRKRSSQIQKLVSIPKRQEATVTIPVTYESQYKDFYEIRMEDPNENEQCNVERDLEEHLTGVEEEPEPKLSQSSSASTARPLLKLFSDEDSWAVEDQSPSIELHHVDISEQPQTQPIQSQETALHFDTSALAEAESYAKAWAHAFLKLSEDQKFYAKRSIDELLVLGRLQRLSISTVTSLTTNL